MMNAKQLTTLKNINKNSLTIKTIGNVNKNKEKYTFSKPLLLKVNGVKIHLKNMSWKEVLEKLINMTEYKKYNNVKLPLSSKKIINLIKLIAKDNKLKVHLNIMYEYKIRNKEIDEEYIPNEEEYEEDFDDE